MSLSPLTFTGVSTFSEDFQMILDRTTKIGALPIQSLQNQQKDILQQKLLLSNLSSAAGSLATAVSSLGSVGSSKALAASSSNTAKVTAANTGAGSAAVYNLTNITSVAKAAGETSLTGYANSTAAAVSATGTVKLKIGTNEHTIDLTGKNNLTGLRDAINNLGAGVTATVLTTGTGANPFFLSLTANSTGAQTLELRDDPSGANANLLTASNQGANTEFDLNGAHVIKSTSFVNDVIPGLTFQVLGTTSGAESVSLTVASDRSKISAGLDEFVSQYNNLREQLNGQVGAGAGLLSGDFLVRELQTRLRSIASYQQGDGAVTSLGDLGIEFDSSGVASLNTTTFSELSDTAITDAFGFLGSTTAGFGALSARLTDISDAVSGMAQIQLDKYQDTDDRITAQITVLSARLAESQSYLAAKLHAADALLASLQSQQSMLTATIDSLNYSLYGTKNQ